MVPYSCTGDRKGATSNTRKSEKNKTLISLLILLLLFFFAVVEDGRDGIPAAQPCTLTSSFMCETSHVNLIDDVCPTITDTRR